MRERLQIYKCMGCDNIIEIVQGGKGELSCCGEPMKHLEANTVDAAKEKHVPVIEKIAGGYNVKVGIVAHPMLSEHYIAWVDIIADDFVYRKFLKPGENPEVVFEVNAPKVETREYCNLHGLWKAASN